MPTTGFPVSNRTPASSSRVVQSVLQPEPREARRPHRDLEHVGAEPVGQFGADRVALLIAEERREADALDAVDAASLVDHVVEVRADGLRQRLAGRDAVDRLVVVECLREPGNLRVRPERLGELHLGAGDVEGDAGGLQPPGEGARRTR